MIKVSQKERNYILAGNYELLDAVIIAANREILLLEKKYDEMLEHKNAEIIRLMTQNTLQKNPEVKRNEDIVELKQLVQLTQSIRELLEVIDAHDIDTLDCDRSGRRCCDCLERARKKVELCMPNIKKIQE